MYVQETGHGGVLSNAILYNNKDIIANSHATKEIEQYCENTSECHHTLIMRQFMDEALDLPLHHHLCCDICACICLRDECDLNVNGLADDSNTCTPHIPSSNEDSNAGLANVPETIQAILKEQLTAYQKRLSKEFNRTCWNRVVYWTNQPNHHKYSCKTL